MSNTVVTPGFTADGFQAFLATREEPDWVLEKRRHAWEVFESLEMPSRKHEQWRRTDLRLLKLNRYGFPTDMVSEPELPPALLSHGVDLAGHLTCVNSQVVSTSEVEELPQGVLFGSLDRLIHSHSELLQPYLFSQAAPPETDKFAALHHAAWSGGMVLYVPRGVKVEKPFHLLSAIENQGVDLAHILVVMEAGAEATLLTETASADDCKGLHCGGMEVILQPGAKLRYVTLQNWGKQTYHFAHQTGVVDRDAALQWTVAALGAKLAKVNQNVVLAGEGANAQVNGVMFTEGKQHQAYHTLQHHQKPHGTSDLLYKGALQDQAHLVWRGMIKVDPQAQRTNGYQRNDNLMLSNESRADSIPGLEIEADDVICTHGSTTGRVEEEQIFYGQTRGLTRREAARMIVSGFFQQVFDRITIESVREALAEAINHRIREF